MNFNIVVVCFFVLIIGGVIISQAYGQVDPLIEIGFLQSGVIYSSENQFHISDDMNIREFFNGNIIRISGQTIEGFPYITYSKIKNDEIDTFGKIFINHKFVKLSFIEKPLLIVDSEEKMDNLSILVQYTKSIFSKKFANISMYIFDKDANTQNDYYQKDGRIQNVDVEILVVDGENQKIYSSEGLTNQFGFYETEFWIPDNYPRDTLTMTINAEKNNSESTKILQINTLGNFQSSGNGTKP